MKTILYVYTASGIGGGSYAMLNIIKALDRKEYKPVVLLKTNGPLVEELRALDIDVYFIGSLEIVPYNESLFNIHNIVSLVRMCKSFKPFTAILKKINPDIVYLNTMMLHPYLKVIKKNGFKSIIHIREHWPEGEHTLQRNLAIKNIRKYADSIVAINTFSASMVADESHRPTIVYDWVDMDKRYKPQPYDKLLGEEYSDKKVYLCTGGYEPIKGTLEIVEAFTSVIEDPDSRLLLLGSSPRIQRPGGIRKFLKNSKMEYAVKLNAAIAKDKRVIQIPSTYYVTDIYKQAYCMLSNFKIPHANLALAENIILQTPVIAARNEEAIEYSLGGELAILFEPNNIEDFKDKLRGFDKVQACLRERLAAEAHKIESMFKPENNIATLNYVYRQTINK